MAQPAALMSTYGRLPISFVRGEGYWLEDRDGRRYLDAISGVGVTALGHAHPAVTEAICRQASQVIHTSNLYQIELQEKLAERLCAVSDMERVFFCNSGAEANEAAIKLARLYGRHRGIERPVIVVMEGAFHGRTMATLTASGNRKIQAGFEPLLNGFARAPYGDLEALRSIARNTPEVVAVLLEPVQGEGGLRRPPEGYLRALQDLCETQQWLLMLDEVQTGNGRTGRYFAYQHEGVVPDVVTTAKGLGNGLPIGACMARGLAAELFQPGNHGSTFGGNPLACAAAIAVLDTLRDQRIVEQVEIRGRQLVSGLQERLGGLPAIVEIRSHGLMVGIELNRPCGELVNKALAAGLLINVTAERVVRLLPPLIIDEAGIEQLLDKLVPLLERFCLSD